MDPDYSARYHSKLIPAKHGSGSNYVQYENAEVDRLLELGAVQVAREDRTATYRAIQEILLEEVPFAPQGGIVGAFVYHKDILGVKPNQYVSAVPKMPVDGRYEDVVSVHASSSASL